MHEIIKSIEAEQDLIDIWLYGADRWGAEQADFYLDRIGNALLQLVQFPESGVDCSDIRPGYRKLDVGRHVTFYRVTGSAVEIVRVLHQRMDVENHL